MDDYDRYLADSWAAEVTKYDRTILTLSTGALVLSVALVQNVSSDLHWPVVLLGAWVALLISLALIIWSYTISKKAIEARWNHDHALGDLLSARAWTVSISGGWLLFAGVIAFVVFAWINLVT